MLCQALLQSSVPACTWGVLPSVLPSASEMNAQLDSGQVIDLAIAGHSTFFALKTYWVAFAVCFGSSSICTVKRRPMRSEAFS
jgi:hypothetical protein